MVVSVEYLDAIAKITKKHGEKVELEENAIVADLLNKLIGLYGSSFKERIFPQGGTSVGIHIAVLVKGTEFRLLDGLDTRLNDGDNVMMATIVMGG
jgi:molybdopterin synthase sulfur carrier subunit